MSKSFTQEETPKKESWGDSEPDEPLLPAPSAPQCKYPYCSAPTDGHDYCRPHFGWICHQKLCLSCLTPKTNAEHPLCQKCWIIQSEKVRQEGRAHAISAGKCVNFRFCDKSAQPGKMCESCYTSYLKTKGFAVRGTVAPPVAEVVASAPQKEVVESKKEETPASFPKLPKKKSVWKKGSTKILPHTPPTSPAPAPAPSGDPAPVPVTVSVVEPAPTSAPASAPSS